MLPLIKAIIVAVIVVGVGAPSAYIAYTYYTPGTVPMTHFIPAQSYAVVHYQNSSISMYAYSASNNTTGVIINYNLKSFESFFNTTHNAGSSSTVNSKINITELNESYFGFSIYKVNGINLNLSSFLSFNTSASRSSAILNSTPSNITLYISPVESSYMVIGNLTSVKASISAEHYGTYLKNSLKYLAVSGTGISFYINMSKSNLSGKSAMNVTVPNFTVYGNIGATTTNITFMNLNASEQESISLFMSGLGKLSNGTITIMNSSSPNPTTSSYELSVGYKTAFVDFTTIFKNLSSSGKLTTF